MLIINNVKIPLSADFDNLKPFAAKALRCSEKDIKSASLYRKSVDARRKNDVHFCCSLIFETNIPESLILKRNKNVASYKENDYVFKKAKIVPQKRPVIVGFGPAGMFAGLTLARAGLKPIILERGEDVDSRALSVKRFFEGGSLNPNSNVQFGEGGAGTFSDGKLNTGIKDVRIRAVLKEFVKHGANKSILTDAKPHIGTDILINVVKSIREEIVSLGGEVRFNSLLENFLIKNGCISGAVVNGEVIGCDTVILATGHSARDTFSMLKSLNTDMIKKPFSMGVRIEHLQSDINKALYGEFAEHKALGAADYKLAVHLENGRGVYTFCMCPGGEVINSSSEEGGVAVNGMSESRRDGKNANSALLVSINPEDLGDDVLSGCELQKEVEKKAFDIANGLVPVETVDSFIFNKEFEITRVVPSVKPGFAYADFYKIFPKVVCDSLKEGILLFDKKISGFCIGSAVLTAPETRSSSPIRILRGENGQSTNISGLYPSGEGAGYAGGIMSAAVDGIKTAEAVICNLEAKH